MTTMTRDKFITGLLLLSVCGNGGLLKETQAFSSAPPPITSLSSFSSRTSSSSSSQPSKSTCSLKMADKPPAGSFFHEVPPPDDSSSSNETDGDDENKDIVPDFDESISQLIRQRREPPLASRPSTIDGVPTEKAGTGFGKPQNSSSSSTVKKEKPINDPSKPERDDQGYTLYTDTETGKKSRVFEALVDYPSIFTMVRHNMYQFYSIFFFHYLFAYASPHILSLTYLIFLSLLRKLSVLMRDCLSKR
jgi:hypothetical protein